MVPAYLVPRICDWFAGRGFEELWVSDPGMGWGVAAHRFARAPSPLERGARMFTFTGRGPAPHRPLKIYDPERAGYFPSG